MESNSRIAIFGDWHGDTAWAARAMTAAAEEGIITFIHVGDHGIHWPAPPHLYEPMLDGPIPPADEYTLANIETAARLGLQGIIVDGNHDNHNALRALPVDDEGFGVISENLRYATRGSRLMLGGKRFGFLGGAFSIDYQHRTQDFSVWIDKEQVSAADVQQLGHDPLDVLVTHDIPHGTAVHKMFQLPDRLERLSEVTQKHIAQAVHNTGPQLLFCGHWHQRKTHQFNRRTRVEVLDRERHVGNAIILDTSTMQVEPLHVR